MPNTFKVIASVTVGAGGASTIAFSSIPSTYTDLVVKVSLRSTNTADYEAIRFYLNGVEGTFKELYGTGSASGSGGISQNRIGYASAANNTANTFANGELYIPNYTSTTTKSASADMVSENNATLAVASLDANSNPTTSAVSSITIFCNTGNLVQYSTATLYGISNS